MYFDTVKHMHTNIIQPPFHTYAFGSTAITCLVASFETLSMPPNLPPNSTNYIMKLKTPITYYGGKQKMAGHILPLIPEHFTYVEPFFGGGAIFFAKPPSPAEVVNDINHRLVNFYKVLKYDFEEIERRVDETFHSREQYRESGATYFSQADQITDPVGCAWAYGCRQI